MNAPSFDVMQTLHHLGSISLAYVLALPIGWEREKARHTAGLRTFPLVAVASCCYVLVAKQALGPSAPGLDRIVQGLMTGIGFIGGGAIFRDGTTIHGTATAAAIWGIGALGAAIGCGQYDIAILLALVNLATLHLLQPFKKSLEGNSEHK